MSTRGMVSIVARFEGVVNGLKGGMWKLDFGRA
jgi:hypothetical protein